MFTPAIASPHASPMASPFVRAQPQVTNTQQVSPQHGPPELQLPRFLNYMADMGGCGHYRILWAEQMINSLGIGVSHSNTGIVGDPGWYTDCKVVQIQRQAADDHLKFVQFLAEIKPHKGFRMIYNIDDVPFREHIPDYNRFKFAFDNDKIRQNCIDIMNMCDEIVVTCDYMRDVFKDVTGKEEITVIPNFPPAFWLDQFDKRQRYGVFQKYKRKPRILYTGSGAHFDVDNNADGKDDFEEFIKFIIDTREKYQWVFVGACPPPLEKYVKSGQIELHPWEPLLTYPKKIASLNATVSIAPLQNNSFNKSKSDIKFVEAAVLGIPCLLQNIETYHTAPPEMKFDNIEEFEAKLDKLVKKQSTYYKYIDNLRAYGETRFLERPENLNCFYELYTLPYGDAKRKHLKRFNP